LQQIGEGGMGAVFLAERQEPVQRKVALKVLKPGMDTRQVVARFEAERQALALMDHPNIAKVLDAGTTDNGRPYFVMELVKGVPITHYCDEHRLTPRQRLELFLPVCQAVQHAHQKSIIHRDLKPSNVLLARYDSQPVPKGFDFGIAKATGPKITERTLFTEELDEAACSDRRAPEVRCHSPGNLYLEGVNYRKLHSQSEEVSPMSEVTRVLSALEQGDPEAAGQLLALVYEDLRKMAAQKLAGEAPGQTLQPTALVHEAYLRLFGGEKQPSFRDRGHFFAAAASAMRRILIDAARRKLTHKRGGRAHRASLEGLAAPEPGAEMLALDEALNKLAGVDPAKARLVELRYFAGLSGEQAAEVLGISPTTADRHWAYARAWLQAEVRDR
jgi:RNA polymerase sigma factor (TIGR02999 family)